MSTSSTRVALIAVLALTCVPFANAQQPAAGTQPTRDAAALTPLTVQVVISRVQGEKKVSSLPYAMAVIANGNRALLRMGANVPIETKMIGGPEDKPAISSFNYRDVGTAIDCTASSLDNGRYSIQLTVEDSSVYGDQSAASTSGHPTIRTFKATNALMLRDGQTAQFTMATDKLTGEVTKVDVTLTVSK